MPNPSYSVARAGWTVREFCAAVPCGVTKAYELIGRGEIATFRIGRARRIVAESAQAYIERQIAQEQVARSKSGSDQPAPQAA